MIGVLAEVHSESGPVGSWIGRNIVWLHDHLPSYLPEWSKWVLLALPVYFLSATFVFMSVRSQASNSRPTKRHGQSEQGKTIYGTIRLKPSLTRIFISIDSFILIAIVFGYFQQGLMAGKWWTLGYIGSFSVALVVAPLMAWFMFVPKVLEYSDAHIRIVTLFRETHQPWKRLTSYRSGMVFSLRFKGELQGYAVFPKAYSNSDWDRFNDYLEARFPD